MTLTLDQVAAALELTRETDAAGTREVTGAYCSDMLSDVMSRSRAGQVWLTIQGHQNVAAVASLVGLAAVVITGGRPASRELIERAGDEGIAVFRTELTTFEAAGRLYALLQREM